MTASILLTLFTILAWAICLSPSGVNGAARLGDQGIVKSPTAVGILCLSGVVNRYGNSRPAILAKTGIYLLTELERMFYYIGCSVRLSEFDQKSE
jgi:hypothetical protein